MENADDFYLVLPSNSSMKYFSNTTTKFTTHIEREIKLQGSWSVGISEIHIPQTIIHFQKHEAFFDFVLDPGYPAVLLQEIQDTYEFKHGLFENIGDLAAEINGSKDILKHQKIIKPYRNNGYWSVSRTCNCAKPHRTYFSRKLAQVLGFDETITDELGRMYVQTNNSKKIIEAKHPPCISRALPNPLFIYSDICTPYNVGDSRSSLLRIVAINTSNYVFGNTVVQSFAPAHYFPVMTNSFQNISIDIRDQFGDPVAFEFGTLTIKLHFKRDR